MGSISKKTRIGNTPHTNSKMINKNGGIEVDNKNSFKQNYLKKMLNSSSNKNNGLNNDGNTPKIENSRKLEFEVKNRQQFKSRNTINVLPGYFTSITNRFKESQSKK